MLVRSYPALIVMSSHPLVTSVMQYLSCANVSRKLDLDVDDSLSSYPEKCQHTSIDVIRSLAHTSKYSLKTRITRSKFRRQFIELVYFVKAFFKRIYIFLDRSLVDLQRMFVSSQIADVLSKRFL
jgi:hypothetical protein